MKKNWNLLGRIFDIALVATVIIVGLQFFGVKTPLSDFQGLSVLSDSMSPTFSAGDLLIVKKVPVSQLRVGDILSAEVAGEIVTHRIEKIQTDPDGQLFVTKGDANDFCDEPIAAGQVLGKNILILPKLGRFMQIISTSRGKLLLIATLIDLWLWLYLLTLIIKLNKGDMKDDELVQQEEY